MKLGKLLTVPEVADQLHVGIVNTIKFSLSDSPWPCPAGEEGYNEAPFCYSPLPPPGPYPYSSQTALKGTPGQVGEWVEPQPY